MSVSAPYGSMHTTGNQPTKSLRAPSLITGTALLFMAVLSALANYRVRVPSIPSPIPGKEMP